MVGKLSVGSDRVSGIGPVALAGQMHRHMRPCFRDKHQICRGFDMPRGLELARGGQLDQFGH